MPQIAFGVDSYQHASLPISARRCINAYLEPVPNAAKSPAAVVCAFGIEDYLTVGTGTFRGATVVNNTVYAVVGGGLYSISPTGYISSLGAISGTGPVFMDGDGSHVMVTVNGPSFVWNGTATAPVSDPDFPGYEWVAFLDGYMVGGPGDGKVYVNHTAFDLSDWNALDFASAEAAPDDVVVGIVDHRELFLFGRDTTEVWYNSGDPGLPLTRTASGFMEVGCTSKYGPAKIDNSIFFPASDGTVRRVNGYTPVRVSTTAIEQAIAKYRNQSVLGQSWIEDGHAMYGLTYDEHTFVYDISTQLWHERQSYGLTNWRVQTILRVNNQTLVGDRLSNRLGILTANTFSEWDQPLVSSVTSPAIPHPDDQEMIQHAYLELIFEQGVGTITGQGSDPKIMVQVSDDDGRTWGNEIVRSLGKMGDYRRSARINRLGSTYRDQGRVYRYQISDPVRRTLVKAITDSAA